MSVREYALILVTTPLVVAVRLALWLLPSSIVVRLVRRLSVDRRVDRATPLIGLTTIVWAVEAVSARVPRATCLTQAISAKLLLRWSGLRSELCLGVACSAAGVLRAHAWLEREGRTIIGGTTARSRARLPELHKSGRTSAPYSR